MPSVEDFYNFLVSNEMTPKDPILIGKLVKYTSVENSKNKDKSEWYLLHQFEDGHYFGLAGDFRKNKRIKYHSYSDSLSDDKKRWYRERQKPVYELANGSHTEDRSQALKERLSEAFRELTPIPSGCDHAWLKTKAIDSDGLLWCDRLKAVAIPIYNKEGLLSLQYVFSDGSKRHLSGLKANGYNIIGHLSTAKRLVFCEGYSDAMTIHSCTGEVTVACFGVNNVIAQACLLKDEYSIEVVLAADRGDAGELLASQWKEVFGTKVFWPEGSDFNEMYIKQRKISLVKVFSFEPLPLISLQAFLEQDIEPLRWVIQDYMLERSVNVTYGAPGVGKTFYLLQKALCLSAGMPFMGRSIPRRQRVLYIDAELGTHLLQARLRELVEINGLEPEHMLKFSIYCFDHEERRLALTSMESRERLEPMIEEHDVIIFDNYLKLVPASDYDKQHLAWEGVYYWLQGLTKRQGKTVIIAHHSPKSGGGMRGAGEMGNDIDSSVCLSKNPDSPPYLSIVVEFDKVRSVEPKHCMPFLADLNGGWQVRELKTKKKINTTPWE